MNVKNEILLLILVTFTYVLIVSLGVESLVESKVTQIESDKLKEHTNENSKATSDQIQKSILDAFEIPLKIHGNCNKIPSLKEIQNADKNKGIF